MKKCLFLYLLMAATTCLSFAQKFVYQAGVHSFFNNNEFTGSEVKNSQTFAGVHFVPQLGLSFQEKHRIFAGFDAMREFGSERAIDIIDPVAYYQFDSQPFVFYMGAFPRKPLLDNYPRMFFQDSIRLFRPIINGFFWELRSQKDNYFNVWLDWTGRQSEQRRESFFMGYSGRYQLGMVYVQHFGYMFHFAASMNPVIPEPVHDNGVMLTSIGLDLAKKADFEKLELNAGYSIGLDRNRGNDEGWRRSNGFLSELKVEYRGIGLLHTLYRGKGQQTFYNTFQNQLYWGDQAYRTEKYNRTDAYLYFIKNHVASVKFIYSFHFLEKKMFHEQSLYACFDLDNLSKKKHEPYKRFWSRWFEGIEN